MGVYENQSSRRPGMHWPHPDRQQCGPLPYDPSRDLSPNLPPPQNQPHSDPSQTQVLLTASSGVDAYRCANNNNDRPATLIDSGGGGVGVGNNGKPSCHQCSHHNQQSGTPQLLLLRPKCEPDRPESADDNAPPAQSNHEGESAGCCAGCGHRISDRYYLLAVDRRWHAACLQCCQCRQALDGELTCYSRDGNIYCKRDYYRLFGSKRCARCQATIPASELVMRARDLVFHLQCFTCALCAVPLSKGDHFGLRDGAVLCRLHYEVASPPPQGAASAQAQTQSPVAAASIGPQPASEAPAAPAMAPGPPLVPPPMDSGSPPPAPSQAPPPAPPPPTNPADFPAAFRLPMGHALGPHSHSIPHPHHLHPHHPHSHHHPLQHPLAHLPHSGDPNAAKMPFFNGGVSSVGPTARQKGRPRKRKPKDMETMTANLAELSSDSYLDGPFGPGTPGLHGNSRSKRMRTSFKHHQLRTMKSYFAINHNPDAKDLKQLSQKTGLPKRVLQVWFQNARAKWRRLMLKQEGKSSDKRGAESPGEMDSYTSGMTGSGGMQPHSPQFILGGSPLEC